MAGSQHLWLFIVSGLLLNAAPGPDSLFIVARLDAIFDLNGMLWCLALSLLMAFASGRLRRSP